MKESNQYKMDNKTFDDIIRELEHKDMSQRDRGTLFEILVKAYFKTEPMYARLFEEVWMLKDVPEKYNIPKADTGVDLVALNRENGELVAIQCKYYSKDTRIQKYHIDSFLNEVGKSYYSEGIIITTTDKWSKNANQALLNRDKSIVRIGLSQLYYSQIDWSKFSFEKPEQVKLKSSKKPRPHQIPAIEAVINGFIYNDRGKLIMAPGTGKTYTSMVIAEEMAEQKEGVFRVLYLVPSIQLLSQSLRSWTADSKYNDDMDTFAVCSDRKVTKNTTGENDLEDITAVDLGYPATTDYSKLLQYQRKLEASNNKSKFLVVFSTYQSIDVIIEAQKNDFYEFDLIICDEAHRTTGATESGKEASAFVKIHNKDNVKGIKRLYQTATPRIYGEDARKKATEMSIVIADMNDEEIYGPEFYRIGFGDAVRNGILTDYKVMVLAVDENVIARKFQNLLANNKDNELEFDDVTKIIGCWNGLIKRKSNSNIIEYNPMKRAIAFAGTIRESKLIKEMFTEVVDHYLNGGEYKPGVVKVEIDHADGSMNALEKNQKISWLKAYVPPNTCRILSNARFLTEGIDIPDLDAVMFLKPRKSRIDIAQAIGRVMRKADGKEYGYVILPIGIPAGADENSVLDKNERYQVVWDVLNALRSIDERFDAIINKLELNKNKPKQLEVIGVGDAPDESEGGFQIQTGKDEQIAFNFNEEEISDVERAIYGKIVKKVGNVRYWEEWSKDVAKIAQQHIMRIKIMIEDTNSKEYNEFYKFLAELRHNINNSISEQQAIEMLAQHLITKPIFEALFETYSFAKDNPVSRAMDSVLKVMDENGLMKEQKCLEDFYESVRVRAQGIDNLKAKQAIVIQLYDKFFRTGFKETTERLGIVFTPVEVVDFIIKSINDVLKKYFGKNISEEGIHILDPFTGTGTFIVRLLQSGLISKEDLLRKYMKEFHANEIVLLSYYIAAINIEETFHSVTEGDYKPFEGIVLTDTFQTTESNTRYDDELLKENNKRIERQQKEDIYVIIGNPPYSAGQSNENDNNANNEYPCLDERIANTYAKYTKAKMKKTLYDSYIRAFRWAADRIGKKGVIGFISNGSFIDSQATDGLRKCWYDEFNYIYIFNLRGDARTAGEQRRKEAGNIFGDGSRTSVAITILVKDESEKHEIYYHDIGDYLGRNEKLETISRLKTIDAISWSKIIPDKNNDWLNQRDDSFQSYLPLYSELNNKIFNEMMIGVTTSRDYWVYGFSKEKTIKNAEYMIENYNSEIERLQNIGQSGNIDLVNTNGTFINWSRALKNKFKKSQIINADSSNVVLSQYRPFCKKWLYYQNDIIEMPSKYHNFNIDHKNFKYIQTLGLGSKREFSVIMGNYIPNFHLMDTGKVFVNQINKELNENRDYYNNEVDSVVKHFGMNKEELFYYIYAVLHSPQYKKVYKNDLFKEIPRIPILKNKKEYIQTGYQLANLHLNYEEVEPYLNVKIDTKINPSYKVQKMKHPKKGELDKIIFNNDITISNIPIQAYEYVVNGKSAIEWIMDQYQVKIDKASGIVDDPNLFSDDEQYIFNLLLRIINVSIQTVDLINNLPKFEVVDNNLE
ncbi:DEAD/DEAH box helicase family protein [Clostridium celatum]|uniref:DEAD/DEAH box helicase n=1 Tax=Clostridium celatum TaxID=36834 RepID=UPI001F2423F9|nr:type ISP restriction/modification enzyme [Clostridium celatum]MCE9654211.1 DEAD/DEAH box helicase family protein [Clostridium celatum]